MACKIPNLIAAILLVLSLLLVLLSFEPSVAGGFMELSVSDQELASGTCTNVGGGAVETTKTECEAATETWTAATTKCDEGLKVKYLVHPTFLTKTTDADGDPIADGKCSNAAYTTQTDCEGASATWTDCTTYDWTAESLNGLFTPTLDGYTCTLNLLRITNSSVTHQRAYANFASLMGAIRQNFSATAADQNNTSDAVFKLLQASGCFLAFGIICHVMAIVMGGFIWNYSKKCNFGICGFIFNSSMWSGIGLLCYIISLCAFAGVYMQGQVIDEYHSTALPGTCLNGAVSTANDLVLEPYGQVKFSPGGAMVLAGILFKAIAITLASYQWYVDQKQQAVAPDVQ